MDRRRSKRQRRAPSRRSMSCRALTMSAKRNGSSNDYQSDDNAAIAPAIPRAGGAPALGLSWRVRHCRYRTACGLGKQNLPREQNRERRGRSYPTALKRRSRIKQSWLGEDGAPRYSDASCRARYGPQSANRNSGPWPRQSKPGDCFSAKRETHRAAPW
jgi:hypothetical protein